MRDAAPTLSVYAVMIRGNTDMYLLDYHNGTAPDVWATVAQWAPVRWTCAQMADATFDFLATLPEQRVVAPQGVAPLRIVHGSLTQSNRVLVPAQDAVVRKFMEARFFLDSASPSNLADSLAALAEAVLICGHTHIAWQARHAGWLALNPGSTGNAIDGNIGAEYALLTWDGGHWQADLRCIPYDLERLRTAFHERGVLDEGGPMARAFLRNAETGQNVAWFLVQHAAALAQDAGLTGLAAFPDDLWARAAETFEWTSEY